jgi:hypothetical protein
MNKISLIIFYLNKILTAPGNGYPAIMGLSNTSGGITYLNLKEGKFARKSANGDIDLFDAVDGLITSVEFQNDEYNGTKFRKLKVVLEDEGQKYLVQVRTDSGYYRGLTNSIANADISQPVKLIANSKTGDNGKPQTTIFVNQNGKALKWKWSKDNQGELPELEKVKVKGQMVYDNSKQLEFFEKFWTGLIKSEKPTIEEDAPF